MNKCKNCNNETKNPKFCCRSCSVSYNNKKYPKRKLEGQCFLCSKPITTKHKYCHECRPYKSNHRDISLKEAIYHKHHKSSAFALIRTRARVIAKDLGWTKCSLCSYDKHIEITHRKPISEFNENTMVSEINYPSNLIPLCRNCHWEVDHDLVKI